MVINNINNNLTSPLFIQLLPDPAFMHEIGSGLPSGLACMNSNDRPASFLNYYYTTTLSTCTEKIAANSLA